MLTGAALAWPSEAVPQARPRLTAQEAAAVRHCLALVRACQLKDGAIRTCADGAPVWIEPYFANHAALALLATSGPRDADAQRVLSWLAWYANHIEEPSGVVGVHEGRVGGAIARTKVPDSVDAYGGTYLLAVARHHRLTGATPAKVTAAAGRSLRAIEALAQKDGLTIAKADYTVKFLLDNVETYAGLAEGAGFFQAVGMKVEAQKAQKAADALAGGMGKFWRGDHFARAIHQDGTAEGKLATQTEAMANLFGLAYLPPPRPALWGTLKAKFTPDGGLAPVAPVERWLIAATRVAPAVEQADWRRRAAVEALRFDAKMYVHRPAVVVLGLVDGAARFPDVVAKR